MKRNKYLNTFDTTSEYENYIESALPDFPNVSLTKDDKKLHYVRTSPNAHVLYGEVVDPSQAVPTISLNGTTNNTTLDELTNMFYLDSWTNTAPTSITINNRSNIKTIKKWTGLDTSNVTDMGYMFETCSAITSLDLSNFNTSNVTTMQNMFNYCLKLTTLDLSNFDTSNVTDMSSMFGYCQSLTTLDLSNWDTSKVTTMQNMFYNCSSLTDVYITVEGTLMKLTKNLSSWGNTYIPRSATIHYNDVDYKWQNNKWTPQN